VEFGHYSA